MAGSCERVNELRGFIKGVGIFEQFRDSWILKDSDLYS